MGGERWMVVNDIYNYINVSRIEIFENKFSTSRENIIPLWVLCILRILMSSCVDLIQLLWKSFGAISSLVVLVRWYMDGCSYLWNN